MIDDSLQQSLCLFVKSDILFPNEFLSQILQEVTCTSLSHHYINQAKTATPRARALLDNVVAAFPEN